MSGAADPRDAEHGREAAAVRAHLALWDALPKAPPPPPFDAVMARVREVATAETRRSQRAAWLRAAAALLMLVGGCAIYALTRPRNGGFDQSGYGRLDLGVVTLEGDAVLARGGNPVTASSGAAGLRAQDRDVVEARGEAVLGLGGRVRITLDAGTRLTLLGRERLALDTGRAAFSVDHRESERFRVDAGSVAVTDLGTRFAVDHDAATGAALGLAGRVLVTVAEGAVDANGARVDAGWGLAFDGAVPVGAPWRLDSKPVISLERGPGPAEAGKPVALAVVLTNPTDGWISAAAPDAVHSPIFLDVTAPSGATTALRVTSDLLEGAERMRGGIAPRGRVALSVRLAHTFTSPGTYRLKAVWQPAGTAERPTSPELVLEVK